MDPADVWALTDGRIAFDQPSLPEQVGACGDGILDIWGLLLASGRGPGNQRAGEVAAVMTFGLRVAPHELLLLGWPRGLKDGRAGSQQQDEPGSDRQAPTVSL